MNYVKGKFRKIIFSSDTGFNVGLFKVSESDLKDLPATITYTGYFGEVDSESSYILHGKYVMHDRYGYQFNCESYDKIKPEDKDAIIDFLTSPFVKGCGDKTAKGIYKVFGKDSLEKIKENINNLYLVPKMTEKKAISIHYSVCKYFEDDEVIINLRNMGFTIKETMNLLHIYGKSVTNIIESNIYDLVKDIDFKKLDAIFLKNNNKEDERRKEASIIALMKILTFNSGDIYLNLEDIENGIKSLFNIETNIDAAISNNIKNKTIMVSGNKYYLMDDYKDELYIAKNISELFIKKENIIKDSIKKISLCESEMGIKYNEEQKNAIITSLEKGISIITGGPGTGKTTIVKGIIKMYALLNKLDGHGINKNVLLLAPTGRASKRMSESTGYGAMTIHRFLKWDKENNVFGVNELNKLHYNLVIIDEVSMIDNHLFASLLRGLDLTNSQIILVGDEYQLPSVAPGLVLNDLIDAGIYHSYLKEIYRQSEDSFIPILAKRIKEKDISEDIINKRDDFNFITCSSKDIKNLICQILDKLKSKKISFDSIQVLAPMYKGENGIDNLNVLLQSVINPKSKSKREVLIGPITYREGDKVINLVNDPDNNIYNGDIGYIDSINFDSKQDFIIVNYESNYVSYKKDQLNTFTHAYAISIHKSQGSEYKHVIMPITSGYTKMLYNKLLYTGVSRAKKTLILMGSYDAFLKSTLNSYSSKRRTTLCEKIENNLK